MAAIVVGQISIFGAVDFRVLLPGFYLAGTLLLGAAIIALYRRWWREEDKTPSASDELARYRTLYEQGTISEEEFNRLRGILGTEIRRSIDLPPRPEQPAPAAIQTAQSEPANEPPPEQKPPSANGIQPA
jgi:hypothetical protein